MPDLTDPAFPHGTRTGYKKGCHANSPCPATPSCNTVANQIAATYRARRQTVDRTRPRTPGRIAHYVMRRLTTTVETVGVPALAEHTGLSVERVQALLDRTDPDTAGAKVPEATAALLDEAWALLVHGKDVRGYTNHGERDTYDHGLCRCAECTAAASRARKMSTAGIKTDLSLIPMTPAMRKRLNDLLVTLGPTELGRLLGMSATSIYRLRNGENNAMRAVNARKMRALTVEAARAQANPDRLQRVPCARAEHIVGTLNALGYSTSWILREAGVAVSPGRSGFKTITVANQTALEALAARIGDKQATPEVLGTSLNAISKTKRRAERAGFYPPAMYDDGVLDRRAIPGHEFASADERCGIDVAVAHELTRGTGESQRQIGERLGCGRKRVERVVERLPFGMEFDGDNTWIKREDLDAAGWVRDLTTAYYDGTAGPVATALALGLREAKDLPQKHPEVVAYYAAQAQAQAHEDEDVAA